MYIVTQRAPSPETLQPSSQKNKLLSSITAVDIARVYCGEIATSADDDVEQLTQPDAAHPDDKSHAFDTIARADTGHLTILDLRGQNDGQPEPFQIFTALHRAFAAARSLRLPEGTALARYDSLQVRLAGRPIAAFGLAALNDGSSRLMTIQQASGSRTYPFHEITLEGSGKASGDKVISKLVHQGGSKFPTIILPALSDLSGDEALVYRGASQRFAFTPIGR